MLTIREEGYEVTLFKVKYLQEIFKLTSFIGKRYLDHFSRSIADYCDAQLDDNGKPWAPLSKDYKEWKDSVAPGKPIGKLYGLMLEVGQVMGEREYSDYRVTMTYGTNPEARLEALKFQEGGMVTGTNQPPRRFYAINPMGLAEVDEFNADYFESYVATDVG